MALVHEDDAAAPGHLLCPVCYDVPPGRIEQCHSGHLICAHADLALSGGEPSRSPCCLGQLRARAAANGVAATCPVCRAPLRDDMARCLAAERTIELLPAACPHCAQVTTRGSLAAHEATCPSAPTVGCAAAAEGCAWEGRASERGRHEGGCALHALCELNRRRPGDGCTQLRVAAIQGDVHEVARLIAEGADVDKASDDGATPLYGAAQEGHMHVVALLLAAG